MNFKNFEKYLVKITAYNKFWSLHSLVLSLILCKLGSRNGEIINLLVKNSETINLPK